MKRLFLLFLVAMTCLSMSATRTHLIQTAWDQENYNSLLPMFTSDSNSVVSGCTTVAAAQVINYYGWLPEYNTRFKIDVDAPLMDFPEGSTEVKDDHFDLWYWSGTYHVDSMPCSADSLMASIFYSEACRIDRSEGTLTSPWTLYGCFSNHYSYDIEAYVTDEYEDAEELVFCEIVSRSRQEAIVQQAIAEGKPVIVNGKLHTFIIDGYDSDSNQYHFNLGWGPDHIFWGPYNSWADGRYSVYIVTPNRNKAVMPEISASDSIPLHIRNIDTQEDHVGYFVDGANYFRFEDHFNERILPGSYEIWLEMPDSTIYAPQLPNNLKSFADGSSGVVAYSFMHNKAIFNVDDRENYGFVLNTAIYYNTQMGYFNIQYQELLTEEALDGAEITAVVDGVTYKLYQHENKYYTMPIRMKRGTKVEWLTYFKNIPFGNTMNFTIPFDQKDSRIMLTPSKYDETHYYVADYVRNEGFETEASLGSSGKYNTTKLFSFTTPTELFLLDEEQYSTYTGPLSILDTIESEYVYMGVDFNLSGARMFVYNRLPIEYEMETGVSFVIDKDTTTYSLAPGSPIPAAPLDPTKPGYAFKGWSPEIGAADTVPNGIKEYHAVFEKGNYASYWGMENLVYFENEPIGQGVFVSINERILSIAYSANGTRDGVTIYAYGQNVKIMCEPTPAYWRALGMISGDVFGYWRMIDSVKTLVIPSWDGVRYTPGPLLAGGRYYFYNMGAQAYLNQGAGNEATLDGAGAEIRFEDMGTNYRLSIYNNNTGSMYLGENGWQETSTDYNFTLEEASDSTYYLKFTNGNYCYWAGGAGAHGDEMATGDKEETPAFRWMAIQADQRTTLTVNQDATYYISNPDFTAGTDSWTGNMTTDSATASQTPLYCGMYAKAQTAVDSLGSVSLSQTITLPLGRYRLTVNAAAECDGSAATNACLYAGNLKTAIGLAGSYSVDFNIGGQPLEIGIKAENSSAKLICLDKVRLTYLGEPIVTFPSMTITYDTMTYALTFTPSDKQAYYLIGKYSAEDLTNHRINPDNYYQEYISGDTWENIKNYIHPIQGDTTIYMKQYLTWGQGGDWTAFANFVDTATILTSTTTRCDFVLKKPTVAFPTMTITYDTMAMALTFTPSDKQAYYLVGKYSAEDLTKYRINPDTYYQGPVSSYSWEAIVAYFNPIQGDTTISMKDELTWGQGGDWTAFSNFVDTATMTASATTRCDFVLKRPTIAFPTMTITYDTMAMALTFTPSDKQAYYLIKMDRTDNLSTINPDTYYQWNINNYTWENVVAYLQPAKGDTTICLKDYITWGWGGDWTAFANFVDSATMIASATTVCEFVLKKPTIAFPSMTITYDPQTHQVTFTPSDKQAYYLTTVRTTEDLTTYNMAPETWHPGLMNGGYSWENIVEYFNPRQGDATVDLSEDLADGKTGDWTAFSNFVDPATMSASAVTVCEFVLSDVTTDLSETDAADGHVIYDILGRRVGEMHPGQIYIIDGRKVLKP